MFTEEETQFYSLTTVKENSGRAMLPLCNVLQHTLINETFSDSQLPQTECRLISMCELGFVWNYRRHDMYSQLP